MLSAIHRYISFRLSAAHAWNEESKFDVNDYFNDAGVTNFASMKYLEHTKAKKARNNKNKTTKLRNTQANPTSPAGSKLQALDGMPKKRVTKLTKQYMCVYVCGKLNNK